MTCTEYKTLQEDIENCKTPDFSPANIEGWLKGLQSLIYKNVNQLAKNVFDKLITGGYYTGPGGWNATKKKRNNAGIDEFFILSTNDYSSVCRWSPYPTITDDLEKLCYLLDNKTVPEKNCKSIMYSEKLYEYENEYFKLKFCKNGNTHYTIKPETRDKLNLIGADRSKIGEFIKIKVFERGK
jgi:hypothetical protein